ncbi:DUF4175 domain-containing protein, partial [Dysosmobacter welbionis]
HCGYGGIAGRPGNVLIGGVAGANSGFQLARAACRQVHAGLVQTHAVDFDSRRTSGLDRDLTLSGFIAVCGGDGD